MILYKPTIQSVEIIERKGFGFQAEDWEISKEEISNAEENLRKTKLIVKEICESWSPATNYYSLLYLEFLKTKFPEIQVTSSKENIIFKIPRKLATKLTSPEAVGRAFRDLNSEGLCLPTDDKIYENRLKQEKTTKQMFAVRR